MKNILAQIGLLILLISSLNAQTNGTQGYFLSPHGLGKTPEVDNALIAINGQLKVKSTTYNKSNTYILDNVKIEAVYNDAKQVVNVTSKDVILVSGGRIQFTYKFNYTKIQGQKNTTGYGYGSVFSDPLNYNKEFAFCQSFLCWRIPAGKITSLTINQYKLRVKRLQPYNDTDLVALQEMLDNATLNIEPTNIKNQFLTIFNQIFPLALNDSLNHEIFGQKINYTFHSSSHGQMSMNIVRQLQGGFGVDPVDGYKVIFITKIQNYKSQEHCTETVRTKHYDFSLYGGSQNIHMNCIYQNVVSHLYDNGWLDTILNDNWESNSFQFYAGDLYDLINNLYLFVNPRSMLDGKCKALKEGLIFEYSRQFASNSYALTISHNCSLTTTDKNGSTIEVLKVKTTNRIDIQVSATTKALQFKATNVEVLNLSFEPVRNFYVGNMVLATYKVKSILKNLVNTHLFGTGFPTLERDSPKTSVERESVLYYDNSHFESDLLEQ